MGAYRKRETEKQIGKLSSKIAQLEAQREMSLDMLVAKELIVAR